MGFKPDGRKRLAGGFVFRLQNPGYTVRMDATPAVIQPQFTCSNKIPTSYSDATTLKRIKAGTTRLVGAANTDGAFPIWADFVKRGLNWNHSHHREFGVHAGWYTVQDLVDHYLEARSYGVVTTIGLMDKLGETTPWGQDEFKNRMMAFDAAAEKVYSENMRVIEPIIRLGCVVAISLDNECAGRTTAPKGLEFYRKWSQRVKQINPNVMTTAFADAWQINADPHWLHTIKEMDAWQVHFYGGSEDFGPHGKGSWVNEKWHYDGVKWHDDWLKSNGTPKPALVTEFGSYNVSPYYVENLLSFQLLAAQRGWHTAQFAYDTGAGANDKYSAYSDQRYMDSLLFGGYLNRNRAGLDVEQGGDAMSATGEKVTMLNRHRVKVGSYVWDTMVETPAGVARVI